MSTVVGINEFGQQLTMVVFFYLIVDDNMKETASQEKIDALVAHGMIYRSDSLKELA